MRQPHWQNIGLTLALLGVAWCLVALTFQYREIQNLKTEIRNPVAVKVRSLKQMDRDLRAQAEATLAAVRRSERSERLVKGRVWERGLVPVAKFASYRGGLER
jgi:hypothetical protein